MLASCIIRWCCENKKLGCSGEGREAKTASAQATETRLSAESLPSLRTLDPKTSGEPSKKTPPPKGARPSCRKVRDLKQHLTDGAVLVPLRALRAGGTSLPLKKHMFNCTRRLHKNHVCNFAANTRALSDPKGLFRVRRARRALRVGPGPRFPGMIHVFSTKRVHRATTEL